MRQALDTVRGANSTAGIGTPSTARSARQAVLRHAAAAESSMANLRQSASGSASASAVLADLEAHLKSAKEKQARWHSVADSSGGWRHTNFGYKSTPDWVHANVLTDELRMIEHDVTHGEVAEAVRSTDRLRRELHELRERARTTEGELQQQLAEVTHQAWRAREELASCERSLRGKQEEASRLGSALAAEEARRAVVEKQRLELRHEREAAQQEASVASARREEVEAQLRESEREVRALREAAALAESSFAERQESQRARLAQQQASSVAELAASAEERRRLEAHLSEVQRALASEAAERGAEFSRQEERLINFEQVLQSERHAFELARDAAARAEGTIQKLHDELASAQVAGREASVRADMVEAQLAILQRELEASRHTTERLERSLEKSTREAEVAKAAALERLKSMDAELRSAVHERDAVALDAQRAIEAAMAEKKWAVDVAVAEKQRAVDTAAVEVARAAKAEQQLREAREKAELLLREASAHAEAVRAKLEADALADQQAAQKKIGELEKRLSRQFAELERLGVEHGAAVSARVTAELALAAKERSIAARLHRMGEVRARAAALPAPPPPPVAEDRLSVEMTSALSPTRKAERIAERFKQETAAGSRMGVVPGSRLGGRAVAEAAAAAEAAVRASSAARVSFLLRRSDAPDVTEMTAVAAAEDARPPGSPLAQFEEIVAQATSSEASARAEASRLRELLTEADHSLRLLWGAVIQGAGDSIKSMVPTFATQLHGRDLAQLASSPTDASWTSLLDPAASSSAVMSVWPTLPVPLPTLGRMEPRGLEPPSLASPTQPTLLLSPLSAAQRAAEAAESNEIVPVPALRVRTVATTRAVWLARQQVLAIAVQKALGTAREELEGQLLSTELMEVELRQKVHNVHRNAVQRRLRDCLFVLHRWWANVVALDTARHAAAIPPLQAALATAHDELELAMRQVDAAAAEAQKSEAIHGWLTQKASALQLEVSSIEHEANAQVAAEKHKVQASADAQVAQAEAAVAEVRRHLLETEERLARSDRELRATREAADAAAVAAVERGSLQHAEHGKTSAALRAALAECGDLDAQLAASHLALETALNEKAAAERTASSEIANLEMQLVEVRRAL
jgi:hypothetical protein